MSIRNASIAAPSTLSPVFIGATASVPRFHGRSLLPRLGTLAMLTLAASSAVAAPFDYVANYADSTVSAIDVATNTVVATIPVGTNPLGVALNPAGDRAYVTNFGSAVVASGTTPASPPFVSVIDTNRQLVITTIPVGAQPQLVTVNPAGTLAYVANLTDSTVSVINTLTNTVSATVPVGKFPIGVAVNPAGTLVYVTTAGGEGSVSVINATTNAITATIPVGRNPIGVVVNPTGKFVYTTNYNSNDVSVIDTTSNTVVATIPVGANPDGIAITPGGNLVYVVNANGGDRTISIIDTTSNTVVKSVQGVSPLGIAINPAGTRAYIPNFNDTSVSVLDLATNTFVATVTVGGAPGFNAVGGAVNLNQQGLTGSWFNAATSGQGFNFEVYPDTSGVGHGQLFGGWFTYDTSAAGGQRWYSLGGDVSNTGAPAALKIYASYGGNFAAPPVVSSTQVGTATLTFADCTHAALAYSFSDGSGRVGTIPLIRLTANVTCSTGGTNANPALDSLLSGAWYDKSASGQGLLFDFSPSQKVLFAGWFTYAPNGAQIGGGASQAWYTLQSNSFTSGTTSISNVPIYASTGGTFNSAVTASTRTQVGSVNIQFQSCSAMTMAYTFTAGANQGKTGSINLSRVGPTPAGCTL